MNEVNESSDYEEILQTYSSHKEFSSLPDDLQTEQGAYDWLRAKASMGHRDIIYYWKQIPQTLVTDALCRFAISQEVGMLANIDPKDTLDYAALCQFAYNSCFTSVSHIHVDYRTEATVAAMIKEPSNFTISFLSYEWIRALMTPGMTETASLGSPDFMSMLPVNQISQAALSVHLGTGYYGYRILNDAGKLDLAADFLRAGHWPAPPGSHAKAMEKPQSLEHALKRILDDEWEELYMAYVMTFPIEEVVPLMSSEHVRLAMQMYAEKELRPVMKMNRHLKAALLEESLGL